MTQQSLKGTHFYERTDNSKLAGIIAKSLSELLIPSSVNQPKCHIACDLPSLHGGEPLFEAEVAWTILIGFAIIFPFLVIFVSGWGTTTQNKALDARVLSAVRLSALIVSLPVWRVGSPSLAPQSRCLVWPAPWTLPPLAWPRPPSDSSCPALSLALAGCVQRMPTDRNAPTTQPPPASGYGTIRAMSEATIRQIPDLQALFDPFNQDRFLVTGQHLAAGPDRR